MQKVKNKMCFKAEETFNGYSITCNGVHVFRLTGEMDNKATAKYIAEQLNKVDAQ